MRVPQKQKKEMLISSVFTLLSGLLAANAVALEERAMDGYIQRPSGFASFTVYSGCGSPGRCCIT
jgi:hypothetical protein